MHASNVIRAEAPEIEPATVAELKAHLRIAHADDDGMLAGLIAAARERLEDDTLRAFIRQKFTADLVGDYTAEAIELPRPRLIEIASLEYRQTGGTWATLSGSKYRANREPALLWLPDEPSDIDDLDGDMDAAYRVSYYAGYGAESGSVPKPLKQAVLMLAGSLYENRDEHITGTISSEVPWTVKRLIEPYRVSWKGAL